MIKKTTPAVPKKENSIYLPVKKFTFSRLRHSFSRVEMEIMKNSIVGETPFPPTWIVDTGRLTFVLQLMLVEKIALLEPRTGIKKGKIKCV